MEELRVDARRHKLSQGLKETTTNIRTGSESARFLLRSSESEGWVKESLSSSKLGFFARQDSRSSPKHWARLFTCSKPFFFV